MSRVIILFVGVMGLLTLFAVSAQGADFNLRLGSPAPPNSEQYNMAMKFATNLEDLSKGAIHTEVIGGGVLGKGLKDVRQLAGEGPDGVLSQPDEQDLAQWRDVFGHFRFPQRSLDCSSPVRRRQCVPEQFPCHCGAPSASRLGGAMVGVAGASAGSELLRM